LLSESKITLPTVNFGNCGIKKREEEYSFVWSAKGEEGKKLIHEICPKYFHCNVAKKM